MGRECRERFPLQVSDLDMHYGTCVKHVPWCMPGSLTSDFLWSRWRGNVPGIPSACATRSFTYLERCPWSEWNGVFDEYAQSYFIFFFRGVILYSRFSIDFGPILPYIAWNMITMKVKGCCIYEPTIYITKLTLTSELWGAFFQIIVKEWPEYGESMHCVT